MSVIKIEHLTKDFCNNKGIFDVSFEIKKGEVFGFLGPNGAGKTTTIRHLLGFSIPDNGQCSINDMDCFTDSHIIKKNLGYLPGEFTFMNMRGDDFIVFMAKMKGLEDLTYANKLVEYFELDTAMRIKRMSKGMKQKLGIIVCFMSNPSIIILDEPTSGLDPLMQRKFISLVLEEKKKGKTILMSSHMFEEVEKTCDSVCVIKEGHIVGIEKISDLRTKKTRTFSVVFNNASDLKNFKSSKSFNCENVSPNELNVKITGDINPLIKTISEYNIYDFSEITPSLEELFMHYYETGVTK